MRRHVPLALLAARYGRSRLATSAAPAALPPPLPPPRYPRRPENNNTKNDPYAWMRTADPRGELAPYLAHEARLFRAAGLGDGPGARALRRAIEEREAEGAAAAAAPPAAAASAASNPEPSGPYEYWQHHPEHAEDDDDERGWALMRRPRSAVFSGGSKEAAVLSAADVARDAALAVRRFWPDPPRSPSSFFSSSSHSPRLSPQDLFGPGFEHAPPDVRLSRDHALLAYLLPYSPSAAARAACSHGGGGGGGGGDAGRPPPPPPPEGAALLVVRPAAAGAIAPPPLAIVRAATGAEFSPWFGGGEGDGDRDPRVYYVEPDAATGRPRRVRGRRVPSAALSEAAAFAGNDDGSSNDDDALLYDEPDPSFFVALTRTKDWRALVVNSHSKVSSEVRLLLRPAAPAPAATPPTEEAEAAASSAARQSSDSLMLVAPRRPGVEYFVEHRRGQVLVLTNAPELFSCSGGGGGSSSDAAPAFEPAAATTTTPSSSSGRDYALLSTPLFHDGNSATWRLGPFSELAPVPTGTCRLSAAAAAAAAADEAEGDENDGDDNPKHQLLPIAATTDMDVFDAGIVLQQRDALGRPALGLVVPPLSSLKDDDGGGRGDGRPPPLPPRLPPWALALEPAANQDPSSRAFRFDLSSPARPPRPYELDLVTGEVRAVRATDDGAPPPRSCLRLVCRRLVAPCLPSDSGEENEGVPVTVLYRRDLDDAQKQRHLPPPITLLEAYGAYGRPLEASWRADRAALALALGWRVALAHARGGGELGRRWHRAGRGSRKGRSARDVVAAARFLVREGLAAEGRLALSAASAGAVAGAGAVLLGARSGLFGAAVLEVPFVDALAEMAAGGGDSDSRSSSPSSAALDLLAQHERDEWGDDEEEAEDDQEAAARRGAAGAGGGGKEAPSFRALERGACPYQALLRLSMGKGLPPGRRLLPPLLLTAAADDARVRPQGVARFAALYRDAAGPGAPVLLRLAAEGGHFGAGTAAGDAGEAAELYEFVRRAIDGGGGGGGG